MQHSPLKPKLLLADEHTLVLDGLRNILSKTFEIVGTSGDGARLIAQVSESHPDVIVSEIDLPRVSGFEALAQLRCQKAYAKLIFLTARADRSSLQHALREGADGYILKRCSSWELEYAIREVLANRTYITPQLKDLPEKKAAAPDGGSLTAREHEVLQLVAEGQSARDIAAALRISPKTVVFHKNNLRQKLSVRNAAEMVTSAVRNGLLAADAARVISMRLPRITPNYAELPLEIRKKEGT